MKLRRGENRECDGGGKMEEKYASRVLVGEFEGKKSLGRTRCEDSVERDTKRNRLGN